MIICPYNSLPFLWRSSLGACLSEKVLVFTTLNTFSILHHGEHLSWPTVTCVCSHQLGWRLHEGDDFHPQENIDKMANGEPLTDQVSPGVCCWAVSAASTECQAFTEPFFCHGGDSTGRTQQVSQRGCIWADGKNSRHKDPPSEPKPLCSHEGFTVACFNLCLLSFLLTVKHKRGGLMVSWATAKGYMFALQQIGSLPFSNVWWLTSLWQKELVSLWHVLNTLHTSSLRP